MKPPQKETIMLNAAPNMAGWRMAMGIRDIQIKPSIPAREPVSVNNGKGFQSLDRWLLTLIRSK